MPNSYTIYQSNQFNSEFQCLQDNQCAKVISDDKKRSSGEQRLLRCVGPNSTLFDGVIGRDTLDRVRDFNQTDFFQHYTWKQDITPSPSIEMIFNEPLVELPNVTLYFFREGRARVPRVSMCFSRNFDFMPCDDIDLPNRPGMLDDVVEWPITLLTNATSVRYLRINFRYDRDEDDDFIFLSEVRIAERIQGTYGDVYIIDVII